MLKYLYQQHPSMEQSILSLSLPPTHTHAFTYYTQSYFN